MKPECSNCQIGGYGQSKINDDRIYCAFKHLAEELGIRSEAVNKGFFCCCYWPTGKRNIEKFQHDSFLGHILQGVEGV